MSLWYSRKAPPPPHRRLERAKSVNEEGKLEKEDHAYERQDFWVSTKNKQLNFLQRQ